MRGWARRIFPLFAARTSTPFHPRPSEKFSCVFFGRKDDCGKLNGVNAYLKIVSEVRPGFGSTFPPGFFLAVLGFFLFPEGLLAQAERKQINLAHVEALAAKAAKGEFKPVADESALPENLRGLSYDRYRRIRFRPEKEFWKPDGLPFGMALFHPGYLFKQPVSVYEFTADYTQPVRFSRDFFDYEGAGIEGSLPADLGYAGLRFSHPLHKPEVYDEVAVFQGASYFRMLGQNQAFGLSARGLALNAGIDGTPEEFPVFTRFWAGKPQPGAASVTLFALLESPSVTGAYQFVINPGKDTVAAVEATLFFRKEVEHIGIAPLTSMFWFGENTTKPFDDHRPEVHDSDGLAILNAQGESLWRPLRNDPARSRTYSFEAGGVKGFGLLQRDRDARSYEDFEARYQDRPGVWIEPKGDWEAGSLRLVELATAHELSDNIVLAWEPATPPPVGEPWKFAYTQTWTLETNPAKAGCHVVATRSGVHEWAEGTRVVVLEFAGPALQALPPEAQPEAVVTVGTPGAGLVGHARVERYPEGGSWRVAFEIRQDDSANPVDGAEVRCALKLGNDYLSETWTSWLPL